MGIYRRYTQIPTLRITGNPAKKEGFGCVFSRGERDLQSPPVLRSHDS